MMKMDRWRNAAMLMVFAPLAVLAQEKHTLNGYVTDSLTGETMIGANVFVKALGKAVATNTYGFYSITLPAGEHDVEFSFLGYNTRTERVDLSADRTLNVNLAPSSIIAKEFELVGEKGADNTESTAMGRAEIDVQKLGTLPALLGEVDILKTIQYLPGVKSNGEGNSGFYVRGGGPDQNLILLDEAPVYNASHLFGFFSVFNADAVKNIELYKGGMPAQYGGRASSVLDITMKEGNDRAFHGQGGIGLISSRLTLEGPIVKEKGSFIVSGRRTYIDVITKPFVNSSSGFGGSQYYFYDLNAKANYRLSDKDRFYLSGYFGRDVFTFATADEGDPSFRIPWGNATLSARWNHVFGPKLFLNTTAIYSDYQFAFEGEQDVFSFSLISGIKDYGLKIDLSHYPDPRHRLKYGVHYTYHIYTPSTVKVESDDVDFNIDEPSKLRAHELGTYFQDEFDLTDEWRIMAGVRLSWFAHVGSFTEYELDGNGDPTGEVYSYDPGKKVQGYTALEPRLAVRYKLGPNSSLKASFNRNQQYVHLASFSSIALPTDVWIPSGKNVKPLVGQQVAAGYFLDFLEDVFESSVEVYYKDMFNLVEYAEGAEPQANGNTNYDAQLVYGDGYSYGAEFFVKKRTGKLNGWVGYTWSRSYRIFPDISNGNEFPSRWDRTHDVSVVAAYDLNERWSFGGVFVYSTGQAVTLPVNRYWMEGQVASQYTERNGYRMAPYHRLDIAATLKNKDSKVVKDPATGEEKEVPRKWRSSWTFSIYNVYNRYNPYFIYFDTEGAPADGNFRTVAKQVSLFGILPSVTWNFQF